MRFLFFSNCHGHTTELLKRELKKKSYQVTTFTSVKRTASTYGYGYDAYCNRLNPLYPFYVLHMILRHDIFVFYGSVGFFPAWRYPLLDRLFHPFIPLIKLLGKKIIYIPIGSDVRIREIHMKYVGNKTYIPPRSEKEMTAIGRGLYCIFSHADAIIALDAEMRVNIEEWCKRFENKFKNKIYDLLLPVELPQKIKHAKNARLRFLHAPVKRKLKGTEYIISAVNRLKEQGYEFDFILLEDVPQKVLFKEVQRSDVVIDQVKEGSIGLFAREGMAYEKPVIAHFVATFDKELGNILIDATPTTIYSVLKDILDGKYDLKKRGKLGREYIKRKHNPEVFANKLLEMTIKN